MSLILYCPKNREAYNPCIGIKEYSLSGISIYPIPASNKLIIKGLKPKEIIKCNLTLPEGKELGLEINSQNELNLPILPEGIYLLGIETTKGVAKKKVVISK